MRIPRDEYDDSEEDCVRENIKSKDHYKRNPDHKSCKCKDTEPSSSGNDDAVNPDDEYTTTCKSEEQ